MLLTFASIIDRTNSVIGRSVIWLIFASLLISAGNAVVRKTFDMSSNAWLEIQWYLYGAAFLLASAYALRKNEHIRVDILYGKLSRRSQHKVDLFGHVFFLMPFTATITAYLIPYVGLSYASGEVSNSAGGLILWPAKALLLAGFVLLMFQGISEIIKKAAILMNVLEDSGAAEPEAAGPGADPAARAAGEEGK
ncbi:TRAP transporter small permease subunit [Castellaniella hirudinis]|uniref:TRAP transporter small permease protein n=1 Tax=Castellaniella hirudinis TaxID=1144617 RepID=A0ABV8S1G8_9BURK